jgi:hypothetical protein
VIGAFLFVWRGFPRFRRADFWGEDANIFWQGEHDHGVHSLLTPYAGYIHVIPRLAAMALSPLSLADSFRAYEMTAVVLALVMMSPVLSSRLAWLLPSRAIRAIAFLALCIVPGVWESYGNLANLIFFAAIPLVLLALSDDPSTTAGRVAEIAALVLLGLSGPECALVLPLFAYRLWRCRSRWSGAVLVVVAATASIQYAIYYHSGRGKAAPDTGTTITVAHLLFERVVGALLVGDFTTQVDFTKNHLFVATAVWLAALAVAAAIALRLAAGAIGAMVILGYAPAAYVYGSATYGPPDIERHLMMPRDLLVLAAVAVVGVTVPRLRRHRPGDVLAFGLAVACLLSTAMGVSRDLRVPSYPQTPDVAAFDRCLATTRTECRLLTQPQIGAWYVHEQGHGPTP